MQWYQLGSSLWENPCQAFLSTNAHRLHFLDFTFSSPIDFFQLPTLPRHISLTITLSPRHHFPGTLFFRFRLTTSNQHRQVAGLSNGSVDSSRQFQSLGVRCSDFISVCLADFPWMTSKHHHDCTHLLPRHHDLHPLPETTCRDQAQHLEACITWSASSLNQRT